MAGEEVGSFFGKLGLKVNESEWARGDKLMDGMKKAAAAVIGFLAVKKLVGFVEETIHAGDEAVKMAQKIGITAESVQELAYAAGQSGADIGSLASAVGKLGKGLTNDIAAGKGPILDAFKSIGVNSETLKGKLSGPGGVDDILNLIADHFEGMPDGIEKTALSMELLGKSGAQLIPFLNSGSKGIAELRAEANDLGVVIDAQTGKSLEAFGDDIDRVKTGFGGLRNTIVTAALPVLREAATFLVGAMKDVVAWVRSHKEEVADFFRQAGATILKVGRVIGSALGIMYDAFGLLSDGLGLVLDAAETVGEALVYSFELAGGAIGAVLDVAEFLYKQTVKGLAFVARGFEWLARKAGEFVAYVGRGARSIVDFFVDVGAKIRDAFESAFEFVVDLPVIKQLIQLVKDIKGLGSDAAASDPYDQALSAGQTHGLDREDYMDEYKTNLRRFKPTTGAQVAPSTSGVPSAFWSPPSYAPGSSTTVGGNRTASIGDVNININGVNDPSANADKVRQTIDAWWSDVRLQAETEIG